MEEEVLFEARHHASRPHFSNYHPQQQQLSEGWRRSLLSYLPIRGITQLKEKWSWYKQPRKLRRLVSLFVSVRGDYVAVSSRNQIIILQKDNDYEEPVGSFTCGNDVTFTCGTWSESHALLGVVDDTDTIYIIKPNGEEITRITKSYLDISSSIIGLIMPYDDHKIKFPLCIFTIFLSDGSFHDVEISKDPSASSSSAQSLRNGTVLQQFPQDLCCWDYHPNLLLFAVVSGAGEIQSTSNGSTGCSVSLWRKKLNLPVEPVVCTNFEGSYSMAKGYQGQLASPKVLLSPQGNFVAALDMKGCLFTFKFEEDKCSLTKIYIGESFKTKEILGMSSYGTEFLQDIVDFTWWSDCILAIAKRNGIITMVGILNQVNVLVNDLIYSMPILERAQDSPGLIFLLENTSSEESYIASEQQKCTSLIEHVTAERSSHLDFSKLEWSLVSLIKRSSLDIYDKLISSQRYKDALDFADRHGLDKDEVRKSQWLSSVQGVREINNILPTIRDQSFILSECVEKVGSTEDAVRALFAFGLRLTDSYKFSESAENENEEIWNFRLARLKLLHFRDRLETFLGINMGRFSVQDYTRFRDSPISKSALVLAEGGKIGALNLLFKRHPWSLIPDMLDILAAIPETIPVQSYTQLLPATSAPSNIVVRDGDWVECEQMVIYIENFYANHERNILFMTEPMLTKRMAVQWPSIHELSSWYKKRARDIDTLSGQLDNCMCFADSAICKGISDLQQFREDIFYLHQLIYSHDGEDEINFSMSLTAWERLPDYDKFKLMLMGVREDNVIPRLNKKAIPFMQKRFHALNSLSGDEVTIDSFLVRWLKEIAAQNNLDICLVTFEEGCKDLSNNHFFKDEIEVVDCALQCIYLCTDMDNWSTMFTILSKLPQMRDLTDLESEGIKQRRKLAEGHIEAGRLLAYYQVPKTISFFLDADLDEKGVKQILRLLLSKFIRSHPSRTDHDWANMWRDLQSLQEKAFPFLDLEYMLTEFCRGLLKAGKFSLARNYLKGTNSVALATDKAENLVIQAAREYFFSAPSLSCPEIWKAKECLNIFPSSRNVRLEADIIDAVTDRLPNLGVNLLPMAFRQIKDPMEIIKLAIASQVGAYLNVDELIEIAKLLGLSSQEDISTVQEAIAREAAFAGDMQLAFDLCLVLAKKGHGSVWDLCAALARSQALESMDLKSQKLLLGFALSHCDEESISELLNEWKDLDMQDHCEILTTITGKQPSEFSEQSSPNQYDLSSRSDVSFEDQEAQFTKAKSFLCLVAENLSLENEYDWESLLSKNTKLASFAVSHLPWLLELSEEKELGKKLIMRSVSSTQHLTVRARAVMTILSWLARNSFAPKDDLIASLAKSIMEPPVSDEEDIIGCSVLLNLTDALYGKEIIEEQLKTRGNYHEFSSLMNVGMMYGLLHNCGIDCENPAQRRELLLSKFQEKHQSLSSDDCNNVHEAQSTFWNEWKSKLEQQKYVADKSRVLEKLIPGVETSRFLSGDMEYIQSVVYSLIESVKLERKQILKDSLILAHTYGLDRSKVLLYYLNTVLVSEVWSVDDITEEILEFKEEILSCAGEAIKAISLSVYPAIDGHDKLRLAFIYNILCECYLQLAKSKELTLAVDQGPVRASLPELARFCDIVGKECSRVSFIKGIDFKNIAGLEDLNVGCFSTEICSQIDEENVEALAIMVQNLVLAYDESVPDGLLSGKDVYKHYVQNCLSTLEERVEQETYFQTPEDLFIFINEIEQTYDNCRKYITSMESPGVSNTLRQFFTVILFIDKSLMNIPCDLPGKECLVKLLNFWIRLINDIEELDVSVGRLCSKCSMTRLTVLLKLLVKGLVSPDQCWATLVSYVGYGLEHSVAIKTFNFCRAMIFCGCGFEAIASVFLEVVAELSPGSELVSTTDKFSLNIQDLPSLYLSVLEIVLQEMASGSVERQNLHYVLSSLSKQEGDLENLKKVRLTIWDRMSKFSHNQQLPSHLRVYVLELLQFISGRKRNSEFFSSAHLAAWEKWDDLQDGTKIHENASDQKDMSNNFMNTLVALKSSQLVSSISPDFFITPEDIISTDSAVSCFVRVSELASNKSHIDALLALMAEWEGLFTTGTYEGGNIEEIPGSANSWNNDDWDEGWESFQEESVEKESNKTETFSIHPLHKCWLRILKKLIEFSSHADIMKLLDQNFSRSYGAILDENDARDLTQTALEADYFLALKMALLLPYNAIQIQCLDSLEEKLKELGGILNEIARDHLFLILVLSSGLLSTIITQTCYMTTFSYICFMVGNFSRQFQENMVRDEKIEEKVDLLFVKVLFPCFIAELVKADQHVLAGFLVTRFMHTNASLSLINISEASLRSYLEKEYQELQERDSSWVNMTRLSEPLSNTVVNLEGIIGNLIQSALGLLPSDFRY